MRNKLLGVSIVVFALALVFVPKAHAVVSCSSVVGSPVLVDVTQRITNDPDSAVNGGSWALDNFTRHIQIWQEGTLYCAKAEDNGTFTTYGGVGGISPQSALALPPVVTGTMVGGTWGEITGTLSTSTPLADVDCNVSSATCASGLTGYWVQNYFPGGTYNYGNNWGWTYTSPTGQAWSNQAAGNTGDISPVYDATSNTGYPSIQEAINAASAGDTIVLAGDLTLSSEVHIGKSLTLDGKGHTIYASFSNASNSTSNNAAIGIESADGVTIKNLVEDGTGSVKVHGINVYLSTNVNLDGVTLAHNSKAGMVVNGSTVAASNLNTNDNAWGSVNVDPGSGVTAPSVFTLIGNGVLKENNQIWSDGGHVSGSATVTVNAEGYTMFPATSGFKWVVLPTVTPNGDVNTNVQYKESSNFSDNLGATAVDWLGASLNDVTVSGNVDLSTVGAYTLTYSATDSRGYTGTATRTVNVVRGIGAVVNGSRSSGGGGGQAVAAAVRGQNPSGQVLGAFTANPAVLGAFDDAQKAAYVAQIKSQLVALINQLIYQLQQQIASMGGH